MNRSDKADRLIINEAYCRAFACAAHPCPSATEGLSLMFHF